jgi:uric acid-xanthine permease
MRTDTSEYETCVQGGLTSDGFCSFLANLMTSMPNTTFSQNNGVISLTKCASRRAGFACGIWLILLGVFGKVAGLITAIPDAVLGGMTIFLFANVMASGIALASTVDLHSRRNKFILAFSMAIGVGVTVWPFAFQDMREAPYTANFWQCSDCSDTLKGVRNGVSIFMSTGYCCGTVIAVILNAILPADLPISFDKHFIGAAEDFSNLEGADEPSPTKKLEADKDAGSDEDVTPVDAPKKKEEEEEVEA